MDIFSAIVLGIVQGLTEFIPVSSSGHLIFAHEILGFDSGGLAFDAVLQLATTFAVLVYFHKDILRIIQTVRDVMLRRETVAEDRIFLYGICIGTVPAVFMGLLLEHWMETTFRSSQLVALMLLLGALLMYSAERIGKQNEMLTLKKSLVIGVFQTLALVPGVSRSGATISGGLFSGLTRETATRFSFLLSLPILAGSGAKKLFDLISRHELGSVGPSLFIASVVAFVVGLTAIHFLISYVKKHTLNIFVWYRVALAIVILCVWIWSK
jgi:undecaprenyl-diphosphatase